MQFVIFVLIFSLSISYTVSQTAATDFVENYAVTWGGSGNEQWFSMCADGSGNGGFYVTGWTNNGNIGIEYGIPGQVTAPNLGGWDWFIIKYNNLAQFQWLRLIQTAGDEGGNGCTSDTSGNVYVGGYLTQSWTDPNSVQWNVPSQYTPTTFIAKYNNAGNYQYATIQLSYNRPGTNGQDDNRAIQLFAKDSYFWVLGTGTPANTQQASQTWLAKLNQADGTVIWQNSFITNYNEIYLGQAVLDSNNLIYVSGSTQGSVGNSHTSVGSSYPGFSNAGGFDGFITVFDAITGDRLTTMAQQTASHDFTVGVYVDGTGLVYVSGSTMGSMNGQPYLTAGNTFNSYLLVYSLPDFELLWTRQYGPGTNGMQILSDGLGGIYQFGYPANCPVYNANLNNLLDNVCMLNSGSSTMLSKFDINGNLIWTTNLNGVLSNIILNSNGVVMMSGSFQNSFESTASYGSNDGFVRKSTLNYNCSCTDLGSLVTDLQQLLNIAPTFN